MRMGKGIDKRGKRGSIKCFQDTTLEMARTADSRIEKIGDNWC
jgi:hypothetical protein